MKLESLNSKKFNELEKMEMSQVIGSGSEATITWTKSSNSEDDYCSDCDGGNYQ